MEGQINLLYILNKYNCHIPGLLVFPKVLGPIHKIKQKLKIINASAHILKTRDIP